MHNRSHGYVVSVFAATLVLVGAGCASVGAPTAQLPVNAAAEDQRLAQDATTGDVDVDTKESEVEKVMADSVKEVEGDEVEAEDGEMGGTGTPTTPPTTAPAPMVVGNEVTVTVHGGSFYFTPNQIKVKKGNVVHVVFTNDGGMHNFLLDAFGVTMSPIKVGETKTLTFTANKTGSFEYYCGVGEHRQMGQRGTLIVE